MKKIFTLLLFMAGLSSHAQWCINCPYFNFDGADTAFRTLLVIDTVNYHHNIWQIGKPQKNVFDSAHSVPKVIVTDTVNPYGANDTSVFILKLPRGSFSGPLPGFLIHVQFAYQLNIDSNAVARLDMSVDHGGHWLNVKDSLPTTFSTNLDSSGFSNLPGWKSFVLNVHSPSALPDTVFFRFTFISDSDTSSKDGWMIDDISTTYYMESVPQLENNNLVSLYPNPSKGHIYLRADKQTVETTVSILDMSGRQVFTKDHVPRDANTELPLPEGVYILRYSTAEEYCTKRLIISHQ